MPPPYRGRGRGRGGVVREEEPTPKAPVKEQPAPQRAEADRGGVRGGRGGKKDAQRGRGGVRGRGRGGDSIDTHPTDSDTGPTSKVQSPVAGAPTPLCMAQTPVVSDFEDTYEPQAGKGGKKANKARPQPQKINSLNPHNFEPTYEKPFGAKKSKEFDSPPHKSGFTNRGLRPVGTESMETTGSETPKRGTTEPLDRKSPMHNDPSGGGGGLVVGTDRYNLPNEREFIQARSIIQEANRPILVALLTSIVDDFPAMANLIRHRYERAVSVMNGTPLYSEAPKAEAPPAPLQMHDSQSQPPPQPQPQRPPPAALSNARNPFYVQPSTFSHTQFYGSQGVYVGPNQFAPATTPYRQSPPPASGGMPPNGGMQHQRMPPHQQGRFAKGRLSGSGIDEQDMCAVHGAMRSVKHLHRSDSGHFACIPGFHCLENSKNNSTSPTPTKEQQHAPSHPPSNVNDDGFTVTSGSHHDAFNVTSAFSNHQSNHQQPEDDGRLQAIFDMFK